jgi:hypothetical protein
MPTLPQVSEAADQLLRQLRSAREVDPDSPAWQEALRIAELLVGDLSRSQPVEPQACAIQLRTAALALQASQYSFAQVRDPGCPQSEMDGPVIVHFEELAAALLQMADTLHPEVGPSAKVIQLADRRS